MTPMEIATELASLGYHVFPLYRGRNDVRLKPFGWAKNEVVDPDKVDKAIPASNRIEDVAEWPEKIRLKYRSEVVGFGIVGIDCVILDLDVKGDKHGLDEFQALREKHKIPLSPMMTVSKSGGLHLFYKKPKKYENAQLKTMSGIRVGDEVYPSIDLRGDGGFVVGPDMLVEDLQAVERGRYGMKGLRRIEDLPEFPGKLLTGWLRPASGSDVDSMASAFTEGTDFKALIRRGIMPDFIPKGARNESFYIFVNVLKSKGVPIDAARTMCQELARRVEEPETFTGSVDLEDMLSRVYVMKADNPYDVAVDLLSRGLFQLTGFKSKLHYVILEDNPYISSKNVHDEVALKTLLLRYQKQYTNDKGKPATLNPIQVLMKIVGDENRVDMLGFKPNAGEVFSLHDEPGAKRFLNTYKPITVRTDPRDLDDRVWSEFDLLISRLFGDKGSEGYDLGMDFLAWLLQTPEVKPCIAPFIMSVNRGVGKSLLFGIIIRLMGTAKDGNEQARLVKLDEITGRFFNPSGCVINLIDEVQFPVHRDTRRESTTFWRHLKNLITSERVSVEIKGGITYQSPNSAAVALAGNFGSYFPIEEFDRRLWIVDNNPPLLGMGTVDRLFEVVKQNPSDPDGRIRLIDTLRYKLLHRKIKNDLSSIRAPMTDVKQEMWENSLTDIEEWFVVHFRDPGNLFAFTPIVSQSAVLYVWDQSGRADDRDKESFFRDLKRRGYLRPIRIKRDPSSSRQFTVPTIGLDGSLMRSDKREVLYTTRDHSTFDGGGADKILDLFHQNCATIARWKQRLIKGLPTRVEAEELLRQKK